METTVLTKENKVDYSFIIPVDEFEMLDWRKLSVLKGINQDIALTVEKILFSKLETLTSVESLKAILKEKLNFINIEKIVINFPDKSGTYTNNKKNHGRTELTNNSVYNNILNLDNRLFGFIYYNDEEEKLQTFRFIINTETGSVKYFD